VEELIIDFDTSAAPYRLYADHTRINESDFARELSRTAAELSGLHTLTVHWGMHDLWLGFGYPVMFELEPSVALDVFGPTLRELWELLAPRVRVFRVHVYVDALETLAQLDGTLAPGLEELDLQVLGGRWPQNTTSEQLSHQLTGVAQSLVIPLSSTLASLRVVVVPVRRENQLSEDMCGEDRLTLATRRKDVQAGRFFEALAGTRFPLLHELSASTPHVHPFQDEGRHIAALIDAHTSTDGALASLALSCTENPDYFSSDDELYDSKNGSYTRMLLEHGHLWAGLRDISFIIPSLSRPWTEPDRLETIMPNKQWASCESGGRLPRSAEDAPPTPNAPPPSQDDMDPGLRAALSVLSAGAAFENITLSGRYLEADELRTVLRALNESASGSPSHHLLLRVREVRPSTLDDLAALAPSLKSLELSLRQTVPDVNVSAADIEEVERAQDPPSVMRSMRYWWRRLHVSVPFITRPHRVSAHLQQGNRWSEEWDRRARREKAEALAVERLFHTEMASRYYAHWALRALVVRHDWRPGCVVDNPPQHALNTALALERSVPGLPPPEVHPDPRKW
jgi:hypothetical protein